MKVNALKPWILVLSLGFFAAALPLRAEISLISTGAVWKYLDTGTDQGTAWVAPAFADGTWASGPAELGFGDGGEATTNTAGFITYYYRHTFNVGDASSITNLRARLKRDDGAVAYLNGVEVFRDNMPAGSILFDTLAATTAADDGATFIAHNFPATGLVSGNNVFAIEVHQSATTSSDISFDLDLVGNPVPSISISSPTNGQTIASSTVSISGTAVPGGTNITSIQVFQGATQIGSSTAGSFAVAWSDVVPGPYTLQAIITDSSGLKATSAPVNITVQAAPASLLIPRNSTWKYHNLNQDLTATAWRDLSYDDSAAAGWGTGQGIIGDNVEGTQQANTVIDIGPAGARFPTLYFRKVINVSRASSYSGLNLRVCRDDAAVIYLNGNVLQVSPEGSITLPTVHSQFTSYTSAGADEVLYTGSGHEFTVPATGLVDGPNVFAVEVKNVNATSSDLNFDLEVEGIIDLTAPVIIGVEPPQGSTQLSLNFIDVVFDDAVLGVNASDLLINSEPATNVVVINPREYTFYFPTPATGTVQVAWSPSHGITDASASRNPFDASAATWTYKFNPNASQDATVIISEFMADNNTGIRDPLDGKRVDWIELYNAGNLEVNLSGWHLTDEATNLTKWTFGPTLIQPNGYLLVYATGDNDPTRPLHTNFKLDNGGEYLALVDNTGHVVSEFAPTYPPQSTDVSYGRDAVDTSLTGYFITPTPGARNATGGSGFMDPPLFSIETGVYTNDSLSLVLTGPASGTIRYTIDGTNPTNTSPAYTAPISITGNVVVKARVYPTSGSSFPSAIVAKSYVLLDANIRDFTSNLPILILDSRTAIPDGVPPGGNRARGAFLAFDTVGGRTSLRQGPELQAPAGLEIFGQTSSGFPKKPYNIEIQDATGNDEEHSVLGLPADADWKLRPAWEKSLMNDFLAFELFEQMGNYSVRRKHVEVFVHQGTGKLTAADYGGVEVFVEKIEIAGNRVDLQKLTPAMTTEPDITGGYIFKKDKDSAGDLNFSTSGANGFPAQNVAAFLKFHDPKPRELQGTAGGTNQQRYLINYLNQMEKSIYAANYTNATGTNHYSYYMDVDAFVEQFWINEFPKQIDGYRLSDYFSKDRNGKVRPVPIWDWNLSFGNANYLDGGHYANWYWNQTSFTDYPWAKRLITGSVNNTGVGDPDFCQKIADRWAVLRNNVLNGYRINARIDELAAQLSEAANRPAPLGDFTKFTRLGIYQWPEPNGVAGGWDVDYQNAPTYAAIISDMKKWVLGRYLWIDSLFITPPTFSQPEGMVTNGTTITLSTTFGATNYYTLDGTDPRLPGGGLAPGALTYTGPITINANSRIFVRARMANSGSAIVKPFQNSWSGPSVATFFSSVPPLRITEVMYNPAGLSGNTNDNDNFEYIEVQNTGGTPLNVNRFSLSGGVQFDFPNALLAAGEYAVIVKDTNAFQLRYGTSIRILGTYTGNLNNDGDHIVLSGSVREPIQDFSYSDTWYPATDGAGFSLVLTNPNAAPGVAANWRASAAVGGSPGGLDPAAPARPGIVVNEVRSFADPTVDAIELYNPTASAVNVGGWFLSDSFSNPKKYTIGPVVNTNDPNAFALGSKGDDVWLFSGNGTDLTGYAHGISFGNAEFGVDFGRYVDSTGKEHFVAQSANTLGATNSAPKVGPIVITEIMYHPSDIAVGTNGIDNTLDEFIELHNTSGASVNLYDSSYPSNTWHIQDAVQFDFPQNTTIPAGGFLLVVGFDPISNPTALNDFKAHHQVPNGIPILGPWTGKLGNDGQQIELRKPRTPDTNGVPYILVEAISYRDTAPWPVAADGFGLSLQRISRTGFGNDPTNWSAALVTPGANYVPGGTPPAITSQPGDQLVFVGSNATFTATATGTAPLRYQWRFMNQNLSGATNTTLVINNFQLSQAGVYNLLVLNSGGFAVGTNFSVSSRVRLGFTAQPVDRNVLAGATTNFSVSAVGSGFVRYQWYYNSTALTTNVNPTATNSVLILTNIQSTAEGSYFCRIVDDYETLDSAVVALSVVSRPVFSFPPVPVTVVEGGTAVFTVAASGSAPMFFNWRTNGFAFSNALPNATIIRNPTNSILILNNVSLTFSNYAISATVTNIAGSPSGGIPSARLFVLPDSDHDGLPDSYEATHPGNAGIGGFDSDGDSMSNAAEYIAGTDAASAASFLKLDLLTPGIGRLQFNAISNRTYSVQYSDTLNPGDWQKLTDVLGKTTSRTETITDPNATTNRFYRLVIPIQP